MNFAADFIRVAHDDIVSVDVDHIDLRWLAGVSRSSKLSGVEQSEQRTVGGPKKSKKTSTSISLLQRLQLTFVIVIMLLP